MVTIAFFEAQKGDRPYYSKQLNGCRIVWSGEMLDTASSNLPGEAEILSVFIHSRIDEAALACFPALRLIATRSTGFSHIDLNACRRRNITVCYVPHYGENTVAEHTFALILSLSRNIRKAYHRTARENFSLAGLQGMDLKGKTLGVIGAGRIGLHVIKIARGFDMHVLAVDPVPNHFLAEVLQFSYVSLEEALAASDIITLHAPLNEKTRHLLNSNNFQKIKKGALLINTARGELVETEALLGALNSGHLAGAGLDVLEGEELFVEEEKLFNPQIPPETLSTLLKNHLLLNREDVVVTPHIAFNSREAVQRIRKTTAENILSFLAGNPQNTVTGP
jgi:D-lactate dehydrogenase